MSTELLLLYIRVHFSISQAARNRELEQQLAETRESARQLQIRLDDREKALKRIEQEVRTVL